MTNVCVVIHGLPEIEEDGEPLPTSCWMHEAPKPGDEIELMEHVLLVDSRRFRVTASDGVGKNGFEGSAGPIDLFCSVVSNPKKGGDSR